MDFEIIGQVEGAETFATGRGIRELDRLNRLYGKGRWRKRKGTAHIRLANGNVRHAELHWYEANGVGSVEFKIKCYLD